MASRSKVRSAYAIRTWSCFRTSVRQRVLVNPGCLNVRRNTIRYVSRAALQAERKTLDELPDGWDKPLEPFVEQTAGESQFPPVISQALANQKRFPLCTLLTRVGQFYELYGDQAEEIGPLLSLKVAIKQTKKGPISMAGFPFFQLDRYLKMLVEEHSRCVALCEEFRRSVGSLRPSGEGEFERKVTRVITPGTLIDERFLDPYEHNYLLCIVDGENAQSSDRNFGLAWLDLSTGDFYTQEAHCSTLKSDISRIGPREILVDRQTQQQVDHPFLAALGEDHYFVTYEDIRPSGVEEISSSCIKTKDASEYSDLEIAACTSLLNYTKNKLLAYNLSVQMPIRRSEKDFMAMDTNTLRTLELTQTMKEGRVRGSFISTIRRTVTKSGARLLTEWLCAPITSISTINDRLDIVEFLMQDSALHNDIVFNLRRSYDSQRLVQRFGLGRGEPDDLLALGRTIEATESIRQVLADQTGPLGQLRDRLDIPLHLCRRISQTIDENALYQRQKEAEEAAARVIAKAESLNRTEESELSKGRETKLVKNEEVWLMRKNASENLRKLHKRLEEGISRKEKLESNLRSVHKAPSLALKATPGMSHIVHVKAKDAASLEKCIDAQLVGSSKTTRSFQLPEWNFLGSSIDHLRFMIRLEEQKTFARLRDEVLKYLLILRRNANVLDELDVACALTTLAKEQHFVRPILTEDTTHSIVGGRHPVVQANLSQRGITFTPNDCFVGDKDRMWLITGPNMGGKSTFLRQNALITVLAQVGSFVPAEFAAIGVVDRIFCRVGASDNLAEAQSTFMVEMMETAEILKRATRRSLVIMDEVGRGTAALDGLALAYSCLHHLYYQNKSRVLFATHFHELGGMIEGFERARSYCTDVSVEADGTFYFLHVVRPGVNTKSQALDVARMAGIPDDALRVAQDTLLRLNSGLHPLAQIEAEMS